MFAKIVQFEATIQYRGFEKTTHTHTHCIQFWPNLKSTARSARLLIWGDWHWQNNSQEHFGAYISTLSESGCSWWICPQLARSPAFFLVCHTGSHSKTKCCKARAALPKRLLSEDGQSLSSARGNQTNRCLTNLELVISGRRQHDRGDLLCRNTASV